MKSPKFSEGQLVKANDGLKASKIIGLSFSNGEWRYTVSAKIFNSETEEINKAVRHYTEKELTAVKEKKDAK